MTPEDLKRILFGVPSDAFNIPDRNGLRLPPLRQAPEAPPMPEPRNNIPDQAVEDFGVMLANRGAPNRMEREAAAPMEFRTGNQPNFNAATQNQNAGNDLASQFGQFDKEFTADLAAGRQRRGQERVDAANAYNKSFEEMLDQNINMRRGMENRNQRAFNGGGPTPGVVGDQAMAMNNADIRKQLAGMNPMVDQLSPLQMRGDVNRTPEDTRDMSPQGVQERLQEAFGLRPGDSEGLGRLQYVAPRNRDGGPNPFSGATYSKMNEAGDVEFKTTYNDPEAMRAANKELMAKRRAAPAQARLNQLQFTQKQLANALSGKPIDDLPDGLSADAANELVRGSARMYRRGENMKTFQDLLAQGLSPDPNPRVREQFAEGALAAKRGQVDADLRARLAGEKMQFDAGEGEKKRASDERIAKMGADAQTATAMSRGNGDQLENKMVAIGYWNKQLLEAEKRKDGPAIAKAKSRIAELSDPSSPNTSEPEPRERATPQSSFSAAVFGAAPPLTPPSPSAKSSPMELPYIPAPNPNDKRKKTGRQPWMDIDPTFGAATDPFIPNAHENWLVY